MRRAPLTLFFAVLLGVATAGRAQVVVNASFESPAISNFVYTTSVTGWTFSAFVSGSGGTGLTTNGSSFGTQDIGGASDPGGGSQAALIQGAGTISQASNFSTGGAFTLSFFAEARGFAGGGVPLSIMIDSTVLTFGGNQTVSPSSGSVFDRIVSDPFSVGAGFHTLSFTGTVNLNTADVTTFVDQVSVTAVPEASTLALLGAGLVGLGLVRRRRA